MGAESPSLNKRLITVPSHGASKSKVDLALSISARFCPLEKLFPGLTCHLTMVASVSAAACEGRYSTVLNNSLFTFLSDHQFNFLAYPVLTWYIKTFQFFCKWNRCIWCCNYLWGTFQFVKTLSAD